MNSLTTIASVSEVFQFFWRGGFFMALLLICSVVSVVVMLLRAGALKREAVMPPEIETAINALRPNNEKKGIARIVRSLTANESSLARIVDVALKNLAWPKSENIEAVQTRARHEIVRLESGLFILEIIVGIAPLLGLLGAVSGLVHVFGAFGDNASETDPHLIAKGIAEALTTTIAGLIVAIPSLIAYSYFSRKVETMAAEMESLVAELLAKCYFLHAHEPIARLPANRQPGEDDDEDFANHEPPPLPAKFANHEVADREAEKHETTKIEIDEKSESTKPKPAK